MLRLSVFFLTLFLSIAHASDTSNLPSSVVNLLQKTTEGKRVLREIKEETFGDVKVELLKNSSNKNGEFEIIKPGKSKIILYKSQSSESMTATLVHEFQHLRDITIVDAKVDGNGVGDLLQMARNQIVKGKGSVGVEKNPTSSEFYGGFLLCFELRAYAVARTLEAEGVQTGVQARDELKFIKTHQLATLNINFTPYQITKLSKECGDYRSFGDYMKNLVRRTQIIKLFKARAN